MPTITKLSVGYVELFVGNMQKAVNIIRGDFLWAGPSTITTNSNIVDDSYIQCTCHIFQYYKITEIVRKHILENERGNV